MKTDSARYVVCLQGLLLAAATACAASPSAPTRAERSGPLANLPSAPGAHLDKIRNLGAQTWVKLGAPAPDPKWGVARGRAWGTKSFALAPEIRGAYFTGEGRHGFVKPDGFGMDDYWVYDINAHRWICIHPGTDTKNLNKMVKDGDLKVNEHGLVVNSQGHIEVGHVLIHAWGWLTYDTDRKKFMIGGDGRSGFGSYYMPGGKAVDEGLEALKAQRAGRNFPNLTPMCYDTASGRFECVPAKNAAPDRKQMSGFPQFLYIPTKKQCMLTGNGRVAWYDPDQRAWTMEKTQGTGPRGGDIAACYDSKRDRVYMGAAMKAREQDGKEAASLLIYDIKQATWTSANAEGVYPNNWSTNYATLHYDTVADRVVAITTSKTCVYDPETNAWAQPLDTPKEVDRMHAFYDPELNVHFMYVAGDSADDGVMWAYRQSQGK